MSNDFAKGFNAKLQQLREEQEYKEMMHDRTIGGDQVARPPQEMIDRDVGTYEPQSDQDLKWEAFNNQVSEWSDKLNQDEQERIQRDQEWQRQQEQQWRDEEAKEKEQQRQQRREEEQQDQQEREKKRREQEEREQQKAESEEQERIKQQQARADVAQREMQQARSSFEQASQKVDTPDNQKERDAYLQEFNEAAQRNQEIDLQREID